MPNTRSRARNLLLIAFCAACGGLAEDGRHPLPDLPEEADPEPPEAATDLPEPAPTPRVHAAAAFAPAATVGNACGHSGEPSQRIIVGEVELQNDARCGSANSCLMRATAPDPCAADSVYEREDCRASDSSEFIPVPPASAPEPAWQAGICTCRCDGKSTDTDYCACPVGMRCAAIIPSAGVNAAARPYVGSYCVL